MSTRSRGFSDALRRGNLAGDEGPIWRDRVGAVDLQRLQLLDVLRGDRVEARAAFHRAGEITFGGGKIAPLHRDKPDIVQNGRQALPAHAPYRLGIIALGGDGETRVVPHRLAVGVERKGLAE